jgi:hypothetical protein
MHVLDLVDETFIAAPNSLLASVVADPDRWRQWWPKRRVEVFMDRGLKGQRWSIAGDLVGSAEIWLEEFRDGVVLHYYLRADPVPSARAADLSPGRLDRLRRAEATSWKRTVWALKRECEADRRPGDPATA